MIDNNAYLNIVSDKGHWLYEDKVIFITSDLLERKVINEFASKDVYFSDNFEIQINQAFQLIGNLSGYGHNYDFTTETNYFIISNKEFENLKKILK